MLKLFPILLFVLVCIQIPETLVILEFLEKLIKSSDSLGPDLRYSTVGLRIWECIFQKVPNVILVHTDNLWTYFFSLTLCKLF
jgi:hypothetical protein